MSRTWLNPAAIVCIMVAFAFACAAAAAADGPTTKPGVQATAAGKAVAVTVYRGQALVTRAIDVDAPAGEVQLAVTGLPEQIVPDSLFASSDGNVKVRAVRYRTTALMDEPTEEIRKIDDSVAEVDKAMRKLQSDETLLRQKEAYLTNLEGFTAGRVKEDMPKGTLNAEAIKGASEFIFTQRAELNDKALTVAEEKRTVQQKLDLLARQRSVLTSKHTRTAREAIVFLDRPAGGRLTVRLTYLVNGASWTPLYNLRASGEKDVNLEYNSLVQQMSGEDWDGVKLTLSTASPNMLSEAPILTPLWVTLSGSPMPGAVATPDMFLGGQRAASENLKKALDERRHATTQPARQMDYEYAANEWANRLQIFDLVAGKDVLAAGRAMVPADATLSVNYELPGTISIPSRRDQQMIQIALLKLQADFYYQAAPVLTPYVYEHADIVNTSQIALLSGPVSSYKDGQFMGTAQMPMVAKGQQFTVGLGIDSQLRVCRELGEKGDKVVGGNRELSFKYGLLVDNYKDKPVKVRLLDRLPDPKGAEIRVTMGTASQDTSKEEVYMRTLRKRGILRWDVDVPARSAGASAKAVSYDFRIEFDRNMHLAEPTPAILEKEKADFRMELSR